VALDTGEDDGHAGEQAVAVLQIESHQAASRQHEQIETRRSVLGPQIGDRLVGERLMVRWVRFRYSV
jgi:hypothetical protein